MDKNPSDDWQTKEVTVGGTWKVNRTINSIKLETDFDPQNRYKCKEATIGITWGLR